jgi:hypothetical protein
MLPLLELPVLLRWLLGLLRLQLSPLQLLLLLLLLLLQVLLQLLLLQAARRLLGELHLGSPLSKAILGAKCCLLIVLPVQLRLLLRPLRPRLLLLLPQLLQQTAHRLLGQLPPGLLPLTAGLDTKLRLLRSTLAVRCYAATGKLAGSKVASWQHRATFGYPRRARVAQKRFVLPILERFVLPILVGLPRPQAP